MSERRCKDCGGQGKRPAPHPGPRCTTHHREAMKRTKMRSHAKRIERVYGLSYEQYEALYEHQGRKCFICHRAKGTSRRLSVDHDHDDGRVRGLLCRPCNDLLGHCRDDVQMLSRAIRYLSYPPADTLGIVAIHIENRETEA